MSNSQEQETMNNLPAIVRTRPPDDDNDCERCRCLSGCFSSISKFLNQITIEPLTFLAIMALYIEFPSIQDLIYTKICLQVISNHPNITLNVLPPQNQPFNMSNQLNYHNNITKNQFYLAPRMRVNDNSISLTAKFQAATSDEYQPKSIINAKSLPEFGRIQNNGDKTNNDDYNSILIDNSHSICDRLNKSATPREIRQEIASGDSLFWLKYQLLICILCALSSPYWGGMSDKIGRLIPLNVPIFMSVICNIMSLIFGLLISLNSHNLFDVEWLYLGAILVGISGGQAVIIINSFSFISDNTSTQSRSKRVVILESVIFVSHSVGYYISKHIMSLGLSRPDRPWFNRHFVAFLTCVIINLIAILYSYINLRHRKFHRFSNNFEREQQETSLPSSSINASNNNQQLRDNGDTTVIINTDRPRELTSSNPDDIDGPIAKADKSWSDNGAFLTFRYYKQTYDTLTRTRDSRTLILLLLLCGFISAMSLASLMSLLFIYLHSDPFNWSTSRYSYWNSITSLTRGIALICLTLTKLFKVCDMPDPIVASLGFLSKGIGLMMIALAQTSDIIDWSILAFTLSEFSMPPIRSLLSKLVVKEEVGKLYSCLAAIQSICLLLGNVVFYLAFTSLELQELFRLCFLAVAVCQFVAVIIMLLVYTTLRHRVMII